jgi:hypothetical protein
LDPKCKSYEILKKTEKEKERRRKKLETGSGQRFSPAEELAHGPTRQTPNRYFFPSLCH